MKFGVREICDVVFKAKTNGKIGTMDYTVGQPVLFIDSAKTSTLEGASTTVYATGGRGNSRLISWEGEKTLTFTVEDALLSPIGFHVLSGAGLFKNTGAAGDKTAYVHKTAEAVAGTDYIIDITDILGADTFSTKSPVFVVALERGSLGAKQGTYVYDGTGNVEGHTGQKVLKPAATSGASYSGQVFVDFYVEKTAGVTTLEIDMKNFAGYWYVEASTLFRREEDGVDMPAELVFPNIKVQSNFTFNMASSGDPSTFTFTMDAMPGYTRFDRTKKVLCAMQIVDEYSAGTSEGTDSYGNDANDDKEYPLP